MLKVLFLIHDLGIGGAEKVLVNLVNHLDPRQFDVTVMTLFGGGVNEKFLRPGIKYHAVFKKTWPANSHIMKLFSPQFLHNCFIKEHYDIEVAYLEGPCARIIGGGPHNDTKLVSWIHCKLQNISTAAASFRSKKESRQCYNRFHKIICVSEGIKQDFSRIYPDLKHLGILYNTNDSAKIIELASQSTPPETFKTDEFKVCVVGKITLSKGSERIGQLYLKLRQLHYNVHFYILGEGPERTNLENLMQERGESKNFTFLGYQTNPYQYVSRCDLLVCASYSEGFSTAATEALIVGTPVVTMDVAGMKEMLGDHNEYGIIVPQDENALLEAVKNLIDHPEQLKYYKQQAQLRGKFFSTENTVNAVEKMLWSLSNGN